MKNQNKDVIKFAENFTYGYNQHTNKIEKLELFEYQKQILKQFEKNKNIIIKQSRQVGVDTVIAVYIAYFITKNKDKSVFIVAENGISAVRILGKIKNILYYMDIRPIINNQKNIELRNESRVTAVASSPMAGIGTKIDLLYIGNFEWVKDSEDICKRIPICLTKDYKNIIYASAPQYKESFFRKLWMGAVENINNFKPIKVLWNERPDFDDTWYKKECERLGNNPDMIAAELNCDFIDKKELQKDAAINIRTEKDKKDKILSRMKQKNISSITEYIMELIEKDLEL